jgi:hypothetical protein
MSSRLDSTSEPVVRGRIHPRLISVARITVGETHKIGFWHIPGDNVIPHTSGADKEDRSSKLSPCLHGRRHFTAQETSKDGRNDGTRAGQWPWL